MIALSKGASINTVTKILNHGGKASINTLSSSGKAAIHYVCNLLEQDYNAYISLLLDNGADLRIQCCLL
jgi:hypothetical protein